MMLCIAGKNNIAVNTLDYIIHKYKKIDVCVVCNKSDIGIDTWQKSLKKYAKENNIKEYLLEDIYKIKDLIFISLQFDRIIRPHLFKTNKLYNVHFSLLPAHKGMYTAIMPILEGDEKAGVTLHKIDAGIDTGDIIDQISFNIAGLNSKELYELYIEYGTKIIEKNLNKILKNEVVAHRQPKTDSTYHSMKAIDFNNIVIDLNQTADVIDRQIRAFYFENYQVPCVFDKQIYKTKILNKKSTLKPGNIINTSKDGMIISSIDYDIKLYYYKKGSK